MGVSTRALLLPILVLIAASGVACATVPPKIRPTSIEPFLGRWSGQWQSDMGKGSGAVSAMVERFMQSSVSFRAEITNADSPGLARGFDEGVASLVDGELVLERGYLYMKFTLHGEGNHLEVAYEVYAPGKRTVDHGRWSLKKN